MAAGNYDRWLMKAGAGMELSWRLAWANWLTISILSASFPAGAALAIFLVAAIIRSFSSGRGFRLITVGVLYLAGFVPGVVYVVHHFHGAGLPVWPLDWLQPAAEKGGWIFWVAAVFESCLAVVIWLAGRAWVRRVPGYTATSDRFDLGLSMLFLLFITKMFLAVQLGQSFYDPQSLLLTAAFVCFGLLSLALARIRGGSSGQIDNGARGLWTVAGVGVAGLLIAAGAMAFFLPQLTTVAEVGFEVLKAGGRPILNIFVAVIRFLYGPRNRNEAPAADSGGGSAAAAPMDSYTPAWLEQVMAVLAWGMIIMVALVAVAALAVVVYYIIRRLLARTEADREARPWLPDWRTPLARLAAAVFRLVSALLPPSDAPGLYIWLQRWGRISGRSRQKSETPREYALRLESSYPGATGDIRAIVSVLEKQVYAGQTPEPRQITMAHRARRRLSGIGWWPRRLKTRLLT